MTQLHFRALHGLLILTVVAVFIGAIVVAAAVNLALGAIGLVAAAVLLRIEGHVAKAYDRRYKPELTRDCEGRNHGE